MTTIAGVRLGATHLLGGSPARVEVVRTCGATGTPTVMVSCPDYDTRLIRITGARAIGIALGPEVHPCSP